MQTSLRRPWANLDRLYDAEGNYHDEVVVAWIENGANCFDAPSDAPTAVPHIAVLNYNGGVSPSVLVQQVTRDDQQYLCTDYLAQGYTGAVASAEIGGSGYGAGWWNLQPVDNIVSTAIGDFDGDGYNELAVGYMRGTQGTVISVVIYRYENDGTNAFLTPVNTFETNFRIERSAVAR